MRFWQKYLSVVLWHRYGLFDLTLFLSCIAKYEKEKLIEMKYDQLWINWRIWLEAFSCWFDFLYKVDVHLIFCMMYSLLSWQANITTYKMFYFTLKVIYFTKCFLILSWAPPSQIIHFVLRIVLVLIQAPHKWFSSHAAAWLRLEPTRDSSTKRRAPPSSGGAVCPSTAPGACDASIPPSLSIRSRSSRSYSSCATSYDL